MSTTVASKPPPAACSLNLESLSHIDVSKLSQSELHALSLCSTSAFDTRRTDDVVTPQIDRSLFNESAGSRRQTYSRLRLRHPHHRTTRLPGLLSNPSSKPVPSPTTDPENHSILHFLKHFLNHGLSLTPPPPPPPPLPPLEEVVTITPQQFELGVGFGFHNTMSFGRNSGEEKRKAGRKRKGLRSLMEMMNKKGEMVDLKVLESDGDTLYSEELKRRTVGLETQEAILGFLTSLEGLWCSKRKRRKYVDADQFGDKLPVGWKLVLGIKRRDGRASVYCRRYISPFGQQFISCKEVAAFLQAHFVDHDARKLADDRASSSQQVHDLASGSRAAVFHTPANVELGIVPYATLPFSSTSDLHGTEALFAGMENLSEVKVQDLFECYKCNLSFDEKNAYLQHLFSFHQQTTKRVKFGKPVGEGVIIKDGKYECQFCHKVFEERRKYNSHVGVHVRNCKGSDELNVPIGENKSIVSNIQQGLALSCSPIEVPVENAVNTTFETAMSGLADRSTGNLSPSTMIISKASDPVTHQQLNLGSDSHEMPAKGCNVDGILTQELDQHDAKLMDVDGPLETEVNSDTKSSNDYSRPSLDDMDKYQVYEQKVKFLRDDNESNDTVVDNTGLVIESNVHQNEVAPTSEFFMQSLDYFSAFDGPSNKEDHEFPMIEQKFQNLTGFEELGQDGIEPFRYNFTEVQGSPSLPGPSFNMANNAGMDEGFSSPIRFNSEEDMEDGRQLTTLCVWCRSEFKLEGVDSDTQSDTIGYMCPTCKDKIAGHLDSGHL